MTTKHFSDTYQQARAKFLSALDLSAPNAKSFHEHPLTGPGGNLIGTDICHFGALPGDAAARLIVSSGTHGIEGYAGSAIQTDLLLSSILNSLPKGLGVTLVHAINPYGFAHDRRVNEDNVDLNRNFIDHTKPLPDNPDYASLDEALNPTTRNADSAEKTRQMLGDFIKAHGPDAMRAAVSQGQYDFPKGIFYGGTKPSWSNIMVRNLCRQLAKGLQTCVILDVHTGLGPSGYGEIIMEDPSDSARFKLATDIWKQGVTSTRPADKDSKSTSAALSGTIDEAFWQELAPATVISTALEFGTVDSNQVSAALRDDNWLYAYGDAQSEEAAQIKQAIRDAFYPQSEKWKLDVLRQGQLNIREAISWLTQQI